MIPTGYVQRRVWRLAFSSMVLMFLMCEGVKMLQKGVAETIEGNNIAPVRDLLPIIYDEKPKMYACKVDFKNLGISESELIDGVEISTLPTI